jgi:hypothetical protein
MTSIEDTLTEDELARVSRAADVGDYGDISNFVREATLRLVDEHIDGDGRLECPHEGCERTFATIRQRRGHLGNVHAQEFPDGDFWCGYCGYGPTSWRGINAHHSQRHSEDGRPVRLEDEPDRDELLAPDDVPDHIDPELLERLYREHGGSYTAMCRAHEFDVTPGRVRHYLIEFGIHEPTPHGDGGDVHPVYRDRDWLKERYDAADGNLSKMHRNLEIDIPYRTLVKNVNRFDFHDQTDPPGKRHGKGGSNPDSAARDDEKGTEPGDQDVDEAEDQDGPTETSARNPSTPGLDVDFEFEDEFQTVIEQESAPGDRIIEGDFCRRCGRSTSGDEICPDCQDDLDSDVVEGVT